MVATTRLACSTTSVMAETMVKVGMSGRYFPFTFVSNDKLQGFEVDLWHEISQRNDYKVKFVIASFSIWIVWTMINRAY